MTSHTWLIPPTPPHPVSVLCPLCDTPWVGSLFSPDHSLTPHFTTVRTTPIHTHTLTWHTERDILKERGTSWQSSKRRFQGQLSLGDILKCPQHPSAVQYYREYTTILLLNSDWTRGGWGRNCSLLVPPCGMISIVHFILECSPTP